MDEYQQAKATRRATKTQSLFSPELLKKAAVRSLVMLRPDLMWKNPVMFTVEVGTVLSIVYTVLQPSLYLVVLDLWLVATLLFANFAEALAEARGKAQADSLRKTKQATVARRLLIADTSNVPSGFLAHTLREADSGIEQVESTKLRSGDLVVIEAGELIPADGEIIEGVASVDESAITGESAPVVREAGGDRSGVTGGTRVLSDAILVRVTAKPGESFLDRMIALVEGAVRQRTPNEIALSIVLAAFTLVFLVVTATLWPFAKHAEDYTGNTGLGTDIPTLVALLVCLIPTTIGALLAAIGIAGMDRALRANIIAKSGKAVEVAGDVDTLLLDKTGTITMGNRRATRFVPFGEYTAVEVGRLAAMASAGDETPEGRSIVELYHRTPGVTVGSAVPPADATFVPFTASARMSGVDMRGREPIRKGASDAVRKYVAANGGTFPLLLDEQVNTVASQGATPLLVCEGNRIAGMVVLEDVLKPNIRERFDRLRKMGLRTVMVTGDNPLTARSIAQQGGVDDYIAEATPEAKLAYICKEQAAGKLVAMMGDGTNDAPALAQADVGVAMNSGTQAAKEAGNMVDLDSDPTKLIEVVEVGKQLLMTRGALTTFSLANDIAKYAAILPAVLMGVVPGASALNVMRLTSPENAILSAVIFNALVVPALIPLALKGIAYHPLGAEQLLRRNLLVYGLGGIIAPFTGIKLIDMFLGLITGAGING